MEGVYDLGKEKRRMEEEEEPEVEQQIQENDGIQGFNQLKKTSLEMMQLLLEHGGKERMNCWEEQRRERNLEHRRWKEKMREREEELWRERDLEHRCWEEKIRERKEEQRRERELIFRYREEQIREMEEKLKRKMENWHLKGPRRWREFQQVFIECLGCLEQQEPPGEHGH